MQAAGWRLLTLPQGWMDLCLLCEGQALVGGGPMESTATPWFFMHVGRLDSICDRKTKTMFIIIIQASQCHRGGGKGREKTSLSFLSLTLPIRDASQGWIGDLPAMEGFLSSSAMDSPGSLLSLFLASGCLLYTSDAADDWLVV